jgi:hypothetical protein
MGREVGGMERGKRNGAGARLSQASHRVPPASRPSRR